MRTGTGLIAALTGIVTLINTTPINTNTDVHIRAISIMVGITNGQMALNAHQKKPRWRCGKSFRFTTGSTSSTISEWWNGKAFVPLHLCSAHAHHYTPSASKCYYVRSHSSPKLGDSSSYGCHGVHIAALLLVDQSSHHASWSQARATAVHIQQWNGPIQMVIVFVRRVSPSPVSPSISTRANINSS